METLELSLAESDDITYPSPEDYLPMLAGRHRIFIMPAIGDPARIPGFAGIAPDR